MLISQPNDTEKYKVKFVSCKLYVPLAQVSAPIYSEINSLFSAQNVKLHYRRTEIRTLSIPKDKVEFHSDLLFQEEIPCRIVICFLEEKAREGDYYKNPFEFRRSWTVKSGLGFNEASKDEILQQELKDLKEQIQFLREKFAAATSESQGRGRRNSDPQTSFLRRWTSSQNENPPSYTESQSEISGQNEEEEVQPMAPTESKKTIYIKEVQLTLNNLPIDMVCFMFASSCYLKDLCHCN